MPRLEHIYSLSIVYGGDAPPKDLFDTPFDVEEVIDGAPDCLRLEFSPEEEAREMWIEQHGEELHIVTASTGLSAPDLIVVIGEDSTEVHSNPDNDDDAPVDYDLDGLGNSEVVDHFTEKS